MVVAILTVAWTLLSAAARRTRAGPVTAAAPAKVKTSQASESLDPRLHLDLLASSEEVKYEGKGKNIFRAASETVVIPKVKVSPLLRPAAGGERRADSLPPPPPPINLKFFGISNSQGEKPKVFLSQGDDVWIAREGDVVDRHYKIVRISPNCGGSGRSAE